MSNRERCIAILDTFDDSQLADIAVMLQTTKKAIDDAIDNAFCLKIYENYLNNPERGEFVDFDEALKICGVTMDELHDQD